MKEEIRQNNSLTAISPLDGRYLVKVEELSDYFSEYALIKYRVKMEIEYLISLFSYGPESLEKLEDDTIAALRKLVEGFSTKQAEDIKEIEKSINHDVKAVEYFVKEELKKLGKESILEYVHFGLTSQDINNTANPLMVQGAMEEVIFPAMDQLAMELDQLAKKWSDVPMLARTHGQPASPTNLGKEIGVFHYRLSNQIEVLKRIPIRGKFGGASGNFNAHHISFPEFDWINFGNRFLQEQGLLRQPFTTQIENYDSLAALFQGIERINTILIDFCRDTWHYISINYITQKPLKNEVGSSAMPHKVNPIDFENAEGNLGMANSIFQHLAAKLPISRLQRDLTDSTVLRNVGVPMAHSLLSYKSILKGLGKIEVNRKSLEADLEANWMIVSEAIQSILRREGYPNPYETLKDLTRGNQSIGRKEIHEFIDGLSVSTEVKTELKSISPSNYTGIFPNQ